MWWWIWIASIPLSPVAMAAAAAFAEQTVGRFKPRYVARAPKRFWFWIIPMSLIEGSTVLAHFLMTAL